MLSCSQTEESNKEVLKEEKLKILATMDYNTIFGDYSLEEYDELETEEFQELWKSAIKCRALGVCLEIFVTAITDAKNERIQHTLYRFSTEFRKGTIKERQTIKDKAISLLYDHVTVSSSKLHSTTLKPLKQEFPQTYSEIIKLNFDMTVRNFSNPVNFKLFGDKKEKVFSLKFRVNKEQFEKLKKRFENSKLYVDILAKPVAIDFGKEHFNKDFYRGHYMGTRSYTGADIMVQTLSLRIFDDNSFDVTTTMIKEIPLKNFPKDGIFKGEEIFDLK